jgi:hypothetical protein
MDFRILYRLAVALLSIVQVVTNKARLGRVVCAYQFSLLLAVHYLALQQATVINLCHACHHYCCDTALALQHVG